MLLSALLLLTQVSLSDTSLYTSKLSETTPDGPDQGLTPNTPEKTMSPRSPQSSSDGALTTKEPKRAKRTPHVPGSPTPTGAMQKPGGFMESDSASSSSP